MKKVDWNEAWAAVERANNVHIVALARYDDGHRMHVSGFVRQGAGRPSTGSTGATVSIFVGRDSEAKELRAELGGHSFIPRIDRLWSQRTT